MPQPLPKFGTLPKTHLVPDVLAPNLDVVFCGTALGHKSALERAYYAHPGNLFWRTLHQTGLTPRQIAPRDYQGVLQHGIGLTDLCKHAYGNDNVLPANALDDIARDSLISKIKAHAPRILAFTSKAAAKAVLGISTGKIAYGFQEQRIGATKLYVLCSPSGLGRGYFKQEVWQQLADAVAALKK